MKGWLKKLISLCLSVLLAALAPGWGGYQAMAAGHGLNHGLDPVDPSRGNINMPKAVFPLSTGVLAQNPFHAAQLPDPRAGLAVPLNSYSLDLAAMIGSAGLAHDEVKGFIGDGSFPDQSVLLTLPQSEIKSPAGPQKEGEPRPVLRAVRVIAGSGDSDAAARAERFRVLADQSGRLEIDMPLAWQLLVPGAERLSVQQLMEQARQVQQQDREMVRWEQHSGVRTELHIPGHDPEALAGHSLRDEYPNRPIAAFLFKLIGDPMLRIIYVTPGKALDERTGILKYLADMLPVPADARKGVLARFHPVGLEDDGDGSVGQKLERNPAKLLEIDAKIQELGGLVRITSHEVFQHLWNIHEWLRSRNPYMTTVEGPLPFFRSAPFGFVLKSRVREVIFSALKKGQPKMGWTLSYPDGHTIAPQGRDGSTVLRRIAQGAAEILKRRYSPKTIGQEDNGTGGGGNTVFYSPDRLTVDSLSVEDLARFLEQRYHPDNPESWVSRDEERYRQHLSNVGQKGGQIVRYLEEIVPDYSPSVQIDVGRHTHPKGYVIISTHEQKIHGTEADFHGGRLGVADPYVRVALHEFGALWGQFMHWLGLTGKMSLDMRVQGGAGSKDSMLTLQQLVINMVDLNLRRGGMNFLLEQCLAYAGSGAHYDLRTSLVKRPDGSYLTYESDDKIRLPFQLESRVSEQEFLDYVGKDGPASILNWNGSEGVIVYMPGQVPKKNMIGAQAIAENRTRAAELLKIFKWGHLSEFAVDVLTGLKHATYGWYENFSPATPSDRMSHPGLLVKDGKPQMHYLDVLNDVRDLLESRFAARNPGAALDREKLDQAFISFFLEKPSRDRMLLDPDHPQNGGVVILPQGITVVGKKKETVNAKAGLFEAQFDYFTNEVFDRRGEPLHHSLVVR